MTTPAPDMHSLLDRLREEWSVVIKERDELRAERTRLREAWNRAKEIHVINPCGCDYCGELGQFETVLNNQNRRSE